MRPLALLTVALAAVLLGGCGTGDVSEAAANKAYQEQASKAENLKKQGVQSFEQGE